MSTRYVKNKVNVLCCNLLDLSVHICATETISMYSLSANEMCCYLFHRIKIGK